MLHDLRKDARCSLQVSEGLEQRDHIEHRHPSVLADRVAREAMDVREIFSGLGERHDVAARRCRTVAFLQERDCAEDLEHLVGLLRKLAGRTGSRIELGQHFRVHSRVLPHFELREVETVGLDLPDQLLQVTVGLPGSPRCDERVLHGAQVGEELARLAVREVGIPQPRCVDLAREHQQDAAVRLVRRPLRDLGSCLFVCSLQPLPQGHQCVGRWRGLGIQGEGSPDALRRALEPQQDVLGGDASGLAGHGCRHERVSVAVAADPRAHAHEGGDERCATTRVRALQHVIEAPIHGGDHGVERLVEDRHDRAHFVDRRRLLRSQRGCAPQGVDLFDHPPFQARRVVAVAQAVVVLLQQPREATDAGRNRPATRLGGVRREDGVEAQRLQAGERGILTDFVCEARVRGLDRVGCALAVGAAVALAHDPHSLVLFDEVHEVEVRRERAGHLMCTLDGE